MMRLGRSTAASDVAAAEAVLELRASTLQIFGTVLGVARVALFGLLTMGVSASSSMPQVDCH